MKRGLEEEPLAISSRIDSAIVGARQTLIAEQPPATGPAIGGGPGLRQQRRQGANVRPRILRDFANQAIRVSGLIQNGASADGMLESRR
jgi:hypothetical protein